MAEFIMPKIANVIVTTDFSDLSREAFPWAQRLANAMDAQLHVVTVVAEPALYPTLDMPTIPMPTVEQVVSAAKDKLRGFIGKGLAGVEHRPDLHVLVGHDVEQIVNFADQLDDAVIVIATHGYGAVRHALLGSTAENVLRRASCPVLSVRCAVSD